MKYKGEIISDSSVMSCDIGFVFSINEDDLTNRKEHIFMDLIIYVAEKKSLPHQRRWQCIMEWIIFMGLMICDAERKPLPQYRPWQCILEQILFMGLMICIAERKLLPQQKVQQCILKQISGMHHHAMEVLLLHPVRRSGAATFPTPRRRHPLHHLKMKTKINSSACICWWRLQWLYGSRRWSVSWHCVYNASLLTM